MSLPPHRMLIGASSLDYGAQGFSALMAEARRPTAIICGNDTIALGALLAAQQLKVEVPADCSITGFDDLAISSRISPGLTTMHVDNAAIGAEAARQLLKAIDQKFTSLSPVEFIPDFRLRGSTAPPMRPDQPDQ
ncbi:substrate-binding domain-containing protein [Neorhizobium sp. S3-V5DH]|uniref:substrate-binding domain-containing protein n=1 Tax=Neorhizobium sp. S3-V5DH TaxID=2485166 RepID=UPI0010E7FF73|nr:substrate-binding domain-containing protein [Neorhizobium sp. S3-V5DH]TCV65890.1 substrate-binding family protein [Neorhizobium sp. S3-V5DH]